LSTWPTARRFGARSASRLWRLSYGDIASWPAMRAGSLIVTVFDAAALVGKVTMAAPEN
jgi:hypothetical protein